MYYFLDNMIDLQQFLSVKQQLLLFESLDESWPNGKLTLTLYVFHVPWTSLCGNLITMLHQLHHYSLWINPRIVVDPTWTSYKMVSACGYWSIHLMYHKHFKFNLVYWWLLNFAVCEHYICTGPPCWSKNKLYCITS